MLISRALLLWSLGGYAYIPAADSDPFIPFYWSSSHHHSFPSAQERLIMFPEKQSATLASGFVSEQKTLKGYSPLKAAPGDWMDGNLLLGDLLNCGPH